jgi:hypothetical protein
LNSDVRDALRTTALELDPQLKEDDLILDADLPVPKPQTGDNTTVINLRSVIDSPLAMKSVEWIDRLVDLIGGYNDKLDQYLDSLLSHESASVGEFIVERLLHKAGLVDIDIKQYGDKLKVPPSVQQKIVETLR